MPDDLRKRSQLDRDSTARPGHTSRSGTSGVSDLRNADPIYKTYADHSLRDMIRNNLKYLPESKFPDDESQDDDESL